MKNKHAKQMIMDVTLQGRKLFWFGEESEKFIANSIDDVIELNREWLGDEEVDYMIEHNEFGELMLINNPEWWFKSQCWNDDLGKMEPTINAVVTKGCYQISTSYL